MGPTTFGTVHPSVEHMDEQVRRLHPGPLVDVDTHALRDARVAAGLTVDQAALVTGFDRLTILRLEGWVPYRGHYWPPKARLVTVERLAAVYGVTVEDLTW